jgi:hypothetical protein
MCNAFRLFCVAGLALMLGSCAGPKSRAPLTGAALAGYWQTKTVNIGDWVLPMPVQYSFTVIDEGGEPRVAEWPSWTGGGRAASYGRAILAPIGAMGALSHGLSRTPRPELNLIQRWDAEQGKLMLVKRQEYQGKTTESEAVILFKSANRAELLFATSDRPWRAKRISSN